MGDPDRREAGLRDVVAAVLSGFAGVRRSVGRDPLRFDPVHLVFAGLLLAATFVLMLVALVNLIVSRSA